MKEKRNKKSNVILELIVFLCGAVVMVFELTGSRILAPYLGNSIYVWSSLIGVILGSLSLGYWYGGRLADKKADYKTFSTIIFISALFLLLMNLLKDPFLNFVVKVSDKNSFNLRWTSLIVVFLLFSVPSILLGMVSPYAVKLKLKDLKTTGRAVGNLYAISTLGSIFGTFLAGFVFIPLLGSTKILYLMVIVLIVSSALAHIKRFMYAKLILLLFAIFILNKKIEKPYLDVDTAYHRVWIERGIDKRYNKELLIMRTGYLDSSMMYLDSDKLAADYTKYFKLIKHFNPDFKKSLMIGGAAYSFPKYYIKNYPDANLDVVEIDPGLTKLAKKYFRLKPNERLNIIHEDGRIYLNENKKKYDAIMVDVFKSYYSVPFHLTTYQTLKKIYNSLNDNGVLITNIISCLQGEKGKFLQAEYKTYKKVFPQVYLFPVNYPDKPKEVQNIIIVALKSNKKPSFTSDNTEINEYLKHLWKGKISSKIPILTDDYAPVDYYNSKII